MTNERLLDGCSVLVVDDDFYLAEDSREMLEEAGAIVMGPYGREDDALGSIAESPPDVAVLDLNLGFGPSFKVARAVKAIGVPMVLVTGYDDDILPPDLSDTPRLRKPVSSAMLIAAVAGLLG
jgi:DNA-binding response OmpR family regulator